MDRHGAIRQLPSDFANDEIACLIVHVAKILRRFREAHLSVHDDSRFVKRLGRRLVPVIAEQTFHDHGRMLFGFRIA